MLRGSACSAARKACRCIGLPARPSPARLQLEERAERSVTLPRPQSLDLRPYEEVKQEQAAAARKGWRGLLAAAQQHKALLLGLLVVALAGGAFLHQQGVFAAAAAQLQAAAASAQRLWAVAAELVG